jgi:hypothetical protein
MKRPIGAFMVMFVLVLAGGEVAARELRLPAVTGNYHAMRYEWGSTWGGALDLILGATLRLDAGSSQPHSFVSKLYDGNPGRLEEPTGSFLIFDGARAAVRISLPEWRQVDRVSVFVLEKRGDTAAAIRLAWSGAADASAIALERRIVETRAGLARVEYRSSAPIGARGGQLSLVYENPDFASAFVAEVAVDGLGMTDAAADASSEPPPRLVWWQRAAMTPAAPFQLHSLLIQAGTSGSKEADLVPAWLVVPRTARAAAVPLVVLLGDLAAPHPPLEVLGFAGRPELALAPALLDAGMAVLVVGLRGWPQPVPAGLQPRRLAAALSQALAGPVAKSVGVSFGALGIWGIGPAADVAVEAARGSRAFRAMAVWHPPARACGWADENCPWSAPQATALLRVPRLGFTESDKADAVAFFEATLVRALGSPD